MTIYQHILQRIEQGKKCFAVLIDPEKTQGDKLVSLLNYVVEANPQLILIGGSGWQHSMDEAVATIKQLTDIPVVLFPGNATQLSLSADGLLFLSLISGRNPEFLIGQQVKAAPLLSKSQLEIIPTGYVLVDGGVQTSVARVSQTLPLSNANEIIATAMAGEMMGQKLIYLEAGSGALHPVEPEIIRQVKQQIHIPLIVGGGLVNLDMIRQALDAGADIIVVGNHFEKHPEDIPSFASLFN